MIVAIDDCYADLALAGHGRRSGVGGHHSHPVAVVGGPPNGLQTGRGGCVVLQPGGGGDDPGSLVQVKEVGGGGESVAQFRVGTGGIPDKIGSEMVSLNAIFPLLTFSKLNVLLHHAKRRIRQDRGQCAPCLSKQ